MNPMPRAMPRKLTMAAAHASPTKLPPFDASLYCSRSRLLTIHTIVTTMRSCESIRAPSSVYCLYGCTYISADSFSTTKTRKTRVLTDSDTVEVTPTATRRTPVKPSWTAAHHCDCDRRELATGYRTYDSLRLLLPPPRAQAPTIISSGPPADTIRSTGSPSPTSALRLSVDLPFILTSESITTSRSAASRLAPEKLCSSY